MHIAPGSCTLIHRRRTQRLPLPPLCVLAFAGFMVASVPLARAHGQGEGLHSLNPPSGGAVVYGTLENQKDQTTGMIYMLRQVHGHFGDRPALGKLVQARDGSSLAAFFTLTDNNFTHTQQGGMVMIDTVNGQMMAAVLTDEFKHFAASEPGMVRALMTAWHPASSNGGAAYSNQGGSQTVFNASTRLYPATGGDHSVNINLPQGWKVTGMAGGSVTAAGPNGEFIGAALTWQGMSQLMSRDLFLSYVKMANEIRQRAGKPQLTFQLTSQTQLDGNSGGGIIAYFIVDAHEGAGPCKGVAQISRWAGGALNVTETWIPVRLYDAEQPLMVKIVNGAHQNEVFSAESAANAESIRQTGIRNQNQTNAINARSDASAASYESQRQAFNNRYNVGGITQANGNYQATGNAQTDEMNAGSQDMQNYILDRGVVQSTSTGTYATFSDNFADDLVKNNPDKLVSTTNRQLLANGQY
jgi:hypothetical protein